MIDEDPKPWITYLALEWLEALIRPEHRVFEWGAAGSTIWFAKKTARIISIEDDPSWFHQVTDRISRDGIINAQVNLIPKSEATGWDLYSRAILGYDVPFDLIFIDGHLDSRMPCAEMAVMVAGEKTTIILDNSDRCKEADEFLGAWASERASFYGAGNAKLRWETTFYYPKPSKDPINADI
jgi:predicted O-methyltransferase YrrM